MADRSERRRSRRDRIVTSDTRLLLAILSTAIVSTGSGCGTSGPVFHEASPDEGRALVYVFRQSRTGGSASAFKIFANSEHVTNMSNGGYFPYAAPVGKLHLKAQMKASVLNWGLGLYLTPKPELELQVEAGDTYYVEFEFGGIGGPGLALIGEERGLALLQECRRTKALR